MRLGVSFSPAGLLTSFHLGALHELKQLGLISNSVALSGSSGGALAAITAAVDTDIMTTLAASQYIGEECSLHGSRKTLRVALDRVLDVLMPANCAEIVNNRPAPCYVAYLEVTPTMKRHVVSKFSDRSDVMDVLRASCNIPYYFNGNDLTVPVRGGGGVDGCLAVQPRRFGCPNTFANDEIVVFAMNPRHVGFSPRPTSEKQRFHVISPSLLSPSQWPLSPIDIMQLALTPPSPSVVSRLGLDRLVSDVPSLSSDPFRQTTVQAHHTTTPLSNTEKEAISIAYQFLFHSGILAVQTWREKSRCDLDELIR